MAEASVSFAGNLTDDPEVRYTKGGIARAMFRVAVCRAGGTRKRRSSPSSCGAAPSQMKDLTLSYFSGGHAEGG
jgi:hypothetical protein